MKYSEEMNTFLDIYYLPLLNNEDVSSLSRSTTINEVEVVHGKVSQQQKGGLQDKLGIQPQSTREGIRERK